MERWELPSSYNVGDEVCLQFGGESPIIRKVWITKVIFTRSKVLYDVEIAIYDVLNTDGGTATCVGQTRIHSVDSAFIKDFDYGSRTVITKWNPRSEYPDTPRKVNCRFTHEGQEFEFIAFVKWEGGGMEWFYEDGGAIRDAVKFEWTEIKNPVKVKDLVKEQSTLRDVENMCLESLAPDEYEEWNKILNIIRTRRKHA